MYVRGLREIGGQYEHALNLLEYDRALASLKVEVSYHHLCSVVEVQGKPCVIGPQIFLLTDHSVAVAPNVHIESQTCCGVVQGVICACQVNTDHATSRELCADQISEIGHGMVTGQGGAGLFILTPTYQHWEKGTPPHQDTNAEEV